ncbi:cupin domain-containing protein [Nocardia carnea]|uniref:cupin domain-containing protein n=1 Tax=Nocardia carnea TaxID=37328 RepID=UPI002458B112|nr:cupin domain-containing protein [Nocardia carnea]
MALIGNVSGAPQIPSRAEAMTILVTLPPGSPGSPPHRHSGPAYGYVLKGEVIVEIEGEPERIVKAGQTFWEPGGDVIHYRDANNLDDAESVFLVTMFCAQGHPMLVPVDADELARRRPGTAVDLSDSGAANVTK